MAPFCAAGAWNNGSWETMEKFTEGMDQRNLIEKSFYQAVLAIHHDQYTVAQELIDKTRKLLDAELTTVVSYSNSHKLVIFVQQLSELEEVIEYKMNSGNPERRDAIRTLWNERLKAVPRSVDNWTRLLAVRNLALSPTEGAGMLTKFANICQKNHYTKLATKTLVKVLGTEPSPGQPLPMELPRVSFAYLKNLWETDRQEAFNRLQEFATLVKEDPYLQARAYHKLGLWQQQLQPPSKKMWGEVISYFQVALDSDPKWFKSWHAWAVANREIVSCCTKINDNIPFHLLCSIKGFLHSISLSPQYSLPDMISLVTLCFKYGELKEVEDALLEGFVQISIDCWLEVLPQILANCTSPVASVRRLVSELLINIGKEHPQALMFPLAYNLNSQHPHRVELATIVFENLRQNYSVLVDQALMVCQGLTCAAVLPHELWMEALEIASRHYFSDNHATLAIETLRPFHFMLEKDPTSMAEEEFLKTNGSDLKEAQMWTKRFELTGQANDYNRAWDCYQRVFSQATRAIRNMGEIQLAYSSPALAEARDLQVAVPGTYKPGKEVIRISSFEPTLSILPARMRSRRITVNGSDGNAYIFLLKGHDDMKQDERAMQFFELVNALLANQFDSTKSHFKIQSYSVVPLAPNIGLVEWMQNYDTLHWLIARYREARNIPVNQEHRLTQQLSPDYQNMTTIQKIETFKFVLDNTDGSDLKNAMWRQSRTAEVWLERRTHYTRSLAVNSMVGYVIGLGDRHLSNLMMDANCGKIIHTSLGDCYEVSMLREKFPETVPFRLTRMLVAAMGVSGYEGIFRSTCENVMNGLRDNKECLEAVLEAFVHEHLIVPQLRTEETNRIMNRISNKLTGKDFSKDEKELPLSVKEQVDKLINQATDVENLCQMYIGW